MFCPTSSVIRKGFGNYSWHNSRLRRVRETWNEELQALAGHTSPVVSVAFSSDPINPLLASASWDKIVNIWDPNTGELQHTLTGHKMQVYSIAFSPDGKLPASGSQDQTVMLWNFTKHQYVRTIDGHSDAVTAVAFSYEPNTQLLASGCQDGTIRLWNQDERNSLWIGKEHTKQVTSLAFFTK